jgi:hypothetical protein
MTSSLCGSYCQSGSTAIAMVAVISFLISGLVAAQVCVNKIPSSPSPVDLTPATPTSPYPRRLGDPPFLASLPLFPHSSTSIPHFLQICSIPPLSVLSPSLIYSNPHLSTSQPSQISLIPLLSSSTPPLQICSAPLACSLQQV